MRTIRLLTEAGASRETVNAAYYRAFEGHRQDRVRAAARVLYDTQPFPLKAASVERLREHQQAGDEIVLVSGAMVDILHPLMDHLDVRFAYCSTPAVANGRYTGELEQRAVGEGKVQAVMQYCAMLDVPPARCSAYGDHISDAPLLCAVGRGHVVDPDAALASLAREKGWKALMTSGARLP